MRCFSGSRRGVVPCVVRRAVSQDVPHGAGRHHEEVRSRGAARPLTREEYDIEATRLLTEFRKVTDDNGPPRHHADIKALHISKQIAEHAKNFKDEWYPTGIDYSKPPKELVERYHGA